MDVSTNRLDNLSLWLKTSGFDHESNELERILKEALGGSGLGSRGFQGQTVSRVTEVKGAINNAASQHSPASVLRHDGEYESVA